jgi:hypothetical protein
MSLSQSLTQTRLHFLSLLAGFTPADEAAQVDWKTDTSPHALDGALPVSIYTGLEPLGGEGRRKSSSAGGKGKERASVGGSGRASPRTSLGGEGSGSGRRKKRRSEVS